MSKYFQRLTQFITGTRSRCGSSTSDDTAFCTSNDSGFASDLGSQSSDLSSIKCEGSSTVQDVKPKDYPVSANEITLECHPTTVIAPNRSSSPQTDCQENQQPFAVTESKVTIPDDTVTHREILEYLLREATDPDLAIDCVTFIVVRYDFHLLHEFLSAFDKKRGRDIIKGLLPRLETVWSSADSFSLSVQKNAHIWKRLISQLSNAEKDNLYINYLSTAFQEKNLVRVVQTLSVMELHEVKRIARSHPQLVIADETHLRMSQMKKLSCDIIEKLYEFSNRYIIPSTPQRAKMIALIAYNDFKKSSTANSIRTGAYKEVASLKAALSRAGFHVIKVRANWTVDQLRRWIKEETAKYRNVCSLLWVTIMTHGDKGTIKGRNGEVGPISDILMDMHKLPGSEDEQTRLRECTPTVLVVQACQGMNEICRYPVIQPGQVKKLAEFKAEQASRRQNHPSASTAEHAYHEGAWGGAPTSNLDVLAFGTAKEDHPKDLDCEHTALIMSTRHGYSSQRNHFIPCLAKELEKVDGHIDLNKIVVQTSQAMERHPDLEHSVQTPTYSHTLRRDLILPKPAA